MSRDTTQLRNARSWQSIHDKLSRFIEHLYRERASIEILEAGCGRGWPLDIKGIVYRLTGVDNDSAALKKREAGRGDLDHAICGDLRTVFLENEYFDVIYSSYVLEHVDGAESLLDKFIGWLKPGGIVILKIPDRDSVFGFITRVTPFSFHVFYKKYIARLPHAGEPGHDPYPTYLDRVVSRKGIHEYCRQRKLNLLLECGTNFYPQRLGYLTPVVKAFVRVVGMLSFGTLASDHSGLILVFQKN